MVDSRWRHFFHLRSHFKILLPLLLITALGTSSATASSVNRTIDDQSGDSVTGVVPTYSPAAGWKQGSTCDGCFIHLDTDHVFDGTWHDATHSPGDAEPLQITAQFTGTAVYVYNVLANTVPYTTTYTSLTFSLDGEQVGTYVHIPTSDTAFQYDVPVYSNPNLANKQHTLVIEATGDTNSSLVLFDYIVYTFTEEDPVPPSSSTTTTTTNPPTTTIIITGLPTSSSSSLSLSLLSSGGKSSLPSSGTPSLTDLNTAPSGNPSAPSTSTSSSGHSSPTIAAANVGQHSSSFPTGAVVAGVVGGVIVIAVVVFLIWLLRRRKAKQTTVPAPFTIDAPERHMHTTSDALVSSAEPHGPGGSTAHAPGGEFDSDTSAAYPVNATARTSNASSSIPHIASTGTTADYLSRPSALYMASNLSQPSDSSRAGLRPLPVPLSLPSEPSEISSAGSPGSTDPFEDPPGHSRTDSSTSSRPSALVQPPRPVTISEKSLLGPPTMRMLPVPPAHSVDAPVSPTVATGTTGTVTILRTQVAALQEEVARLREENEMQMFMDDAPPCYYEAGV